ncbi:G2 and S phase-expressed protein 1 isoform X1 [Pleuronectes platessa]|uniref:G2 and S phase-expressed protein 1 isoform X1 n=1 Tax=Pleuronectes platessa TaxID=8262 RepID=UPI00232A4D5D|nr:G2 and S phase-expressed protein 1 isoform X1 [Pleuronectes platessa]
MDCRANVDLFFLPDETLDFDVSLSPASFKGDEDEDEVFLGPVSHKERCASVNVAPRLEDLDGGERVSLSPLTEDQLESVCQEALKLATQLQNSELSQPHREVGETTTMTTNNNTTNHRDEFVQDKVAKLNMLGQTASALSPIKRQTFCVQDSPMKELPPAVQRRLLRGSGANIAHSVPTNKPSSTRHTSINVASSNRLSSTTSSNRLSSTASSTRPTTRLSTSSPVTVAKAQPRMVLRGKVALGVGVVLPSKPAAPPSSCSASKSRVEKTRLQPPSKVVGGRRRSPSSHPSSRAESYEDLISDSASMASDLSDSSLNSSLLGKRMLAPPTKNVVRNLSGVKAPPLQNRRVADRKNTSSSSSSVSSFNSSLSVSPTKGKLNSSLNRSLSSTTGPAPNSINRLANPSKPCRSTVYATADPTSSTTGGRRSLSMQARKLSDVEPFKAIRSTSLKRAEATPLQLTPAKRMLQRTSSVPPTAFVRPQSGLKAKPKPEAQILPTASGGARGDQHGDGVPKMLKPTRMVSASSMESLPQKLTAGPLTPCPGGCKSLQMKARRPSALPTPLRHRMSSIPTPTPTKTRPARPPPTSDTDSAPSADGMESSCSPAPVNLQEEEPVDAPDIQPFSLEEEQPPDGPPCSAPQPEQSESMDPNVPSQVQSEPIQNLIELGTAEESNSKAEEILLLDLPAPTLQPQEKLLIDLNNTPDLIRTNGKTCTTTQQLIDLSSPLIRWSPEDKKENNAPLINLSF